MKVKNIIILAGILIVAAIVVCLCCFEMDFFKRASQPDITTNAVTTFTDATAILGGNIIGTGAPLYTEIGIVYATAQNPTTANNKMPAIGVETGSFTVNVSDLTANTRYYVRAYAINSEETIYGTQVRFTTTATTNANYILDDGSAETNLSFFDNNSLGNLFYVGEDGVLTSVNVYAQNRSDNANKHVIADIYDAQRQLVVSSAPFSLAGDDWVTVPLNNVPYSDIFYVMIRWSSSEQGTHGLGYDTNGNYANTGYNWLRNNNGNWSLLHETNSQYPSGVFMIRANVNTSGTGTVKEVGRLPALSAAIATAVTATTVTLTGSVINAGAPAYTERGLVYCTHTNPVVTCAGKIAIAGTGTGSFSTNVSDLRANTTYYARAYAINAGGTAYGNEIIFTTLEPTNLPVLTTNAVTNITASTATIEGNIINTGTPAYTERGVVYCTHSNPTVACTKIVETGTGIGNFSTDVSGLRANTTYYTRTYTINADGTFYGNETTFTTPAATPNEAPDQVNDTTLNVH